jgi:hypothetical protein
MVDEPQTSEIRSAKMCNDLGENLEHRVDSALGTGVSSMITHNWQPQQGLGGARNKSFELQSDERGSYRKSCLSHV